MTSLDESQGAWVAPSANFVRAVHVLRQFGRVEQPDALRAWAGIRGDHLPGRVALLMLDTALHHGTDVAMRMLQAAMAIPVDGVLTDALLGATQAHGDPRELVVRIGAHRAVAYAQSPALERDRIAWYRALLIVVAHALI